MYAQLLYLLLLIVSAPTSGSLLIAANSQDFRRVAEKVLPPELADKITNYLKVLSLTNRRVNEDDVYRYIHEEIDPDDVYKQDPASFIANEAYNKPHYSVNVNELVGKVKGLFADMFDQDGTTGDGFRQEPDVNDFDGGKRDKKYKIDRVRGQAHHSHKYKTHKADGSPKHKYRDSDREWTTEQYQSGETRESVYQQDEGRSKNKESREVTNIDRGSSGVQTTKLYRSDEDRGSDEEKLSNELQEDKNTNIKSSELNEKPYQSDRDNEFQQEKQVKSAKDKNRESKSTEFNKNPANKAKHKAENRNEKKKKENKQTKKHFKYYTTLSTTGKPTVENFDKEVKFDEMPLGKSSMDRDKASYEQDKRFTRTYYQEESERTFDDDNNHVVTVEQYVTNKHSSKKHKGGRNKRDSDERNVENATKKMKRKESKVINSHTTESVIFFLGESEILEPHASHKGEHKSKNKKEISENNPETNQNYDHTTESYKTKDKKESHKSKKTRFEIEDGNSAEDERNINKKYKHELEESEIKQESKRIHPKRQDDRKSNQDNQNTGHHRLRDTDKSKSSSQESEVERDNNKNGKKRMKESVQFHEEMVGDSHTRDWKADPVNKIVGTKVPTRPHFTLSTPDHYHRQENVAVAQDAGEPLPRGDQEAER